jgi:uncharacterized RDD family membrane protein YckC
VNPDPRVRQPATGQPGPPQQRWPGYGPAPAPYGYPGHPPYRLPPPPPVSPSGQPLANFGDRLLAYLLDLLIFMAAAVVLMVPFFAVVVLLLVPQTQEMQPDGTPVEPGFATFFLPLLLAELVFVLLMLGVYYLYSVEYQGRSGQTVGKRVMKIRVVPLDPAARLDRGMLAKRFLVQYVAGFVPLFSYLDGFWQLWDKPYQQCLHDKFAKTAVVKVVA